MHEEGQARWDPENDPEYSQRLLPYLARRYYSWLLAGALVGALGFAIVALYLPASYSTAATIKISKTSGGAGGLLAGVPQLLSGKANAALLDEMQILTSRELGLPIIDQANLQIEIYDPGSPDGPLGRVRTLMAPGEMAKARADRYGRFSVTDIQVSENMPEDTKFWITADGQGNWSTADHKHGPNNQHYDFGDFSFTPHFSKAHKAGDRYFVIVKTPWEAWKDYRNALGVRPATLDSSVVIIAFSHSNPYTAKRVIELLTDAYFKRNQETTYGNFDTMLKFVGDEYARSDKRLIAATDELRQYQEKNQIYAPDAQGQAAAKEIADLSTTQTADKIKLEQAKFVLHLLDTRTPEEVYSAIKTPGVAGALEGESEDLAKLIDQLHVARQTKTEEHPEVQALHAQIKNAVAQLHAATQAQIGKLQVSSKQFDTQLDALVGQLSKLPAATGKLALLDAQIKAEIEVQKMLKTQEAQTKISRVGTSSEVRQIDTPPVPFERDSPRVGRSLGLGAVAGLFIMILVALALDASRRGFRSLRELRLGAGLPVLGVLQGKAARGRWRPGNGALPDAPRLAQWLLGGRRSLGIVQLGGSSARYDLVWSLACLKADAVKPAVLVDLDRLGSTLRDTWQLAAAPGLAEVATGVLPLETAAHKLREGVSLLPPGGRPLSAEEFAKAWIALSDKAGVILVCLPPPAQWQDQALALPLVDGVVLSVPQGAVPAAAIELTARRLRAAGCPLLGVVVTNYSPVNDVLGTSELGLLAVEPEGAH